MPRFATSLFRDGASSHCTDFLDALLKDYPGSDFQVRLWDGSVWGDEIHPLFTLVLKHPGALRAMFSYTSELTLGEAYI